MNKHLKTFSLFIKKGGVDSLIFLAIIATMGFYLFLAYSQKVEADFEKFSEENSVLSNVVIIQENSILPVSGPILSEEEIKITKKIKVVVTGYSSSPWQTDDTPFLTAAGTQVRDGVVATNILPFGTKIRLPEIYGDKIFVVEDRMSPKKGYQIDIWFSSYWEAKNFGVEMAEMEIVS